MKRKPDFDYYIMQAILILMFVLCVVNLILLIRLLFML